MKLRDYLKEKKISQLAFSKKLGINSSYLCRIINGRHIPGKLLMEKIMRITKNSVTQTDF